MRVELIRHGETPWMKEKKYQGRSDIPLSEEGLRKLKPASFCPKTVYVSGMIRANQTALALFPGAAQIIIPAFSEMDFGDFEGRSADEMSTDPAYREWVDGWCMGRCPGGESTDEFCSRVCTAFSELMDELIAKNPNEDCIIVAHGGTAMAIMHRFAAEKRSFHEWHLKSGCGYVLEGKYWKKNRTLELLSCSDYNNSKED